VSEAYESPFKFPGTIGKVEIKLGESGLRAGDDKILLELERNIAAARE
jgi:hypothetical protein